MDPVVQPSASVAATGLGIRYIGKHAYAYSGSVDVDNTETTMLEFQTGSGYIIFNWVWTTARVSGEDFDGLIYLNDIVVYGGTRDRPYEQFSITPILIPPHTKVKITLENVTNTAVFPWTVMMVGEVYGAE